MNRHFFPGLFSALFPGLCIFALPAYAQTAAAGFTIENIGSQSIPVSFDKMTNIVFPIPIHPGARVNKDIQVQKLRGSENILILRAARKDFTPTNLAVYGEDGRLYSFDLHYIEDPPVLNFKVVGNGTAEKMPFEIDAQAVLDQAPSMHRIVQDQGTGLTFQGAWLLDGYLWFSFRLDNHSHIDFLPEHARFTIRDRHRVKRTAIQEIMLQPVYENPLQSVPGNSWLLFAIGFHPLTLAKDKQLLMQLGETGGGRNLSLIIRHNDLLKAKLLENGSH